MPLQKLNNKNINKTILIVEDEVSLLQPLSKKIKQEGFHTLEAKNGAEALMILLKNKVDLVLLDIVMPVMDGITVLQKMRADKKMKNVPVIILTNLTDDHKMAEALENGAYDFLVKSDLQLEDIIKKIKDKLTM